MLTATFNQDIMNDNTALGIDARKNPNQLISRN